MIGRIGVIMLLIIPLTATMFILSGMAAQQSGDEMPYPPNFTMRSDLIKIHAEPDTIVVNNISSSIITITVYWPENLELIGGQPAANTRVDVSADVGTLIDAKNESNRGKDITVYTDNSGNATVIFASMDEGGVNITVRAPLVEHVLDTMSVVQNSTEISVMERVEETDYGWRFYMRRGVDYVSLPVIPSGDISSRSPEAVFGDDVEVWEWNALTQSWMRPNALEAGKGYLIRCPERRVVDIHGARAGVITWKDIVANLKPGWNLIGPGDKNVEIGSSRFLVVGWDGVDDTWVPLYKGDVLKRGYGYWIYVP